LSVAERDPSPDGWWDDLDAAVVACLEGRGAMAPHEVGRHVGLSASAVASILCLLALEGRVRICLVEKTAARSAEQRAA
jgi:hypothetical protein